jgi:hypothetical protein
VNILKADEHKCDEKLYYYHALPPNKLNAVIQHGIVHPKQRCLHDETKEDIYVAPGNAITFTHQSPPTGTPVFMIRVDCADKMSFEAHTSIPSWFAVAILGKNETQILTN